MVLSLSLLISAGQIVLCGEKLMVRGGRAVQQRRAHYMAGSLGGCWAAAKATVITTAPRDATPASLCPLQGWTGQLRRTHM